MSRIANFLKEAREKKNIRLEEIASVTKINLHSLQMMEQGRWAELPPPPFILGFISSYAKYVGIDSKEAIAIYKEEFQPTDSAKLASENPSEISAPREIVSTHVSTVSGGMSFLSALSWKKVIFGFGAVGILVIGFVLVSVGRNASQSLKETSIDALLAEAPESSPPSPSPAVSLPLENPIATRDVASPVFDFAHELAIEVKQRTWAKIVIDNDAPKEMFLNPGERIVHRGKAKLRLVLGNATGTIVNYNGKAVDGVRYAGTVRAYIFPPNSDFPQDVIDRDHADTKPSASPRSSSTESAPEQNAD